jgi:hypothetical protein
MRFNQSIALCAFFFFFLLITIAQCLSINGIEHGLPHGLKHVRKNIVANLEALLPVKKRDAAPSSFNIELVNNINSANVHAYIQTTDGGTKDKVLITSEGQVYKPVASSKDEATPVPKSAKCGIPLGPLGSTTTITMPIAMLTGRIYVADGELDISALQVGSATELQHPSFANEQDPNFNTSFGFVEINQPDSKVWANPTYVDFVGLPIAMEMVFKDYALNVSGLPANGVKQVCDRLKDEENKDGYPWSSLCLKDDSGEPFRVLSPEHRSGSFTNYFDDYINQVWTRFGTDGIVFDLQSNEPLVSCHMHGDSMVCSSTPLPFSKPASAEIWGCNTGPFANTGDACHDHTGSRFCAAFHRGTLLLPGGAIQPNLSISKYYPGDAPHNKYARIVHEVQVDHMGYTFPYDDVKPDFNSEVSGTISGENPSALRIYVGGRDLGSRDLGGGQQSSACYTCDSSSSSSSTTASATSTESAPFSSAAASTMATETTPSSSSTTDAIAECTEDTVCTPDDPSFSVTTTTIPVTVTVQESEETPPPVDCEESCVADSDDSSLPVEIVTEIVGSEGMEYVTVLEVATVTEVVTETTVIMSEETGYWS